MRQFPSQPHPYSLRSYSPLHMERGGNCRRQGRDEVKTKISLNIVAPLLCVFLILAGCNLNAPEDELSLAEPDVVLNPTICVPISGWQTYVVQPGDTLTTIAQASGSSVDQLADANCLANRNRLVQGQYLRVPSLPSDATTPSQLCPLFLVNNTGTDYVLIANGEPLSVDCVRLRPGVTYTISWPAAPADTPEVTFYRLSEQNATTRPDVIGVDNNGADGFSIEWLADASTPPSVIYAIGRTNSDALGIIVGE